MRNDFRQHRGGADTPSHVMRAGLHGPLCFEEERRRAHAAGRAKERAAVRRAKLAERWVVLTAAAMLAIAMLPVVLVIALLIVVRSLWRRFAGGTRSAAAAKRAAAAVPAPAAEPAESSGAAVGIRMPRRRTARQLGTAYATGFDDRACRCAQAAMKGA